jgi:hypothetical protein
VGIVFGLDTATSTYYFPQLAFGSGWQTTLTYVDYSPQSTSCQTTFYGDSGAHVMVPFGQTSVSVRSDTLNAGATLHQQTTADPAAAVTSAWAVAVCSSPIKASILYRYYSQGVAQGEAGVNATTIPTTEFVTYTECQDGNRLCKPVPATGQHHDHRTQCGETLAGQHGGSAGAECAWSGQHRSLPGLPHSFTGSVQITSTVPIVSLSLNAEAFPVFSALPPGDLSPGTPLAPGH